VRHRLPVILAVGLAVVLAGARSFAAIGEWVADQPEPALAGLGVGIGGRPRESTIRRAMARLDADLLDRVIGAFLWTRARGRQSAVIAIDGRTVRGACTHTMWQKVASELALPADAVRERAVTLMSGASDAFADAARDPDVLSIGSTLPGRLVDGVAARVEASQATLTK